MFLALINNKLMFLYKVLIFGLPTFLFFVGIIFKAYRGLLRGYRKSMYLFVQSLIIFLIQVLLYLVLCETTFGDKLILSIANLFMGGEGGLQEYLGVSTELETFREVLVKGLPNVLNVTDELAYAISIATDGSGAYIELFVNYIYHLSFAFLFYIIYLLLDFIFYLLFSIFNSERKYKKKINKKFRDNKEFHTYRKNIIGGACVGAVRGLIHMIIMLSFYGGTLFMLSGDSGKGTLEERDFGNDSVNEIYDMYQILDSYGSKGVFKTLNYFEDEESGPVYLIFADTINSGKITKIDPVTKEEYTYKLSLREGVSSYTSYAKSIINIMAEYSEEDVRAYFLGEIDADEFLNRALNYVLYNPSFQLDVIELIDDLPTNTYTVQLALSICDSVVKEIDTLNLPFSDVIAEPLRILFAEGYYSNYIKEEKELKSLGCTEVLPYISVRSLLSKDDVTTIIKLALNYLNMGVDASNLTDLNELMPLVEVAINYIEKLSIFSTERRGEVNSVIGRLYNFVESTYLDDEDLFFVKNENKSELKKLGETNYQKKLDEYKENITSTNWIGEVVYLLDAVHDISVLYQNVMDIEGDALTKALTIFDSKNSKYEENQAIIDNLCSLIYDSTVLGKVLSTKAIYGAFEAILSSIATGYKLPEDISYVNTYDENGNRVKTGDLYYLIRGVKLLLTSADDNLIKYIKGSNEVDTEILLTSLSKSLKAKDEIDGLTITDYVISSDVVLTFVSQYLINLSNVEGTMVYITKEARVRDADGNVTNVLKRDMAKELLDLVPELISSEKGESIYSIIKPLISGDSSSATDNLFKTINKLINNETVNALINNKVLQGLLGNILFDYLESSDVVVLPSHLNNPENWVSTSTNTSEIVVLFDALKMLGNDIEDLFNDQDKLVDNLIGILINLARDGKLEKIFDSDILLYTLSSKLSSYDFGDDFKLIIPNNSRKLLEGEKIDYVINKEDIVKLINCIIVLFDIKKGESISNLASKVGDYNSLLSNAIKNSETLLSSSIISASLAYTFNKTIGNMSSASSDLSIVIPEDLVNDATEVQLKYYSKSNGWYTELRNFFDAINEVYNITAGGTFDLTSSDAGDKITDLFKNGGYNKVSSVNSNKTKIDLLYDSRIISATLSKVIDKYLTDDIIEAKAKERSKNSGIYDKEELKSVLSLLDSFGISSLSDASGISISSLKNIDGLTDDSKNLYLVRGIISKAISKYYYNQDTNPTGMLVSHPLALESSTFPILRKNEIKAILDVLGEATDLSTWNPASQSFETYISYIYDENGNTSSYLIVSTLSKKIIDMDGLVVPKTVLDSKLSSSYQIISPLELSKLLKILDDMLNGGLNMNNFSINDIKIGVELFESEIMNATICKNLKFESDSGEQALETYSLETRVTVSYDMKDNKIFYLNKDEYTALVDVVEKVFGESGLKMNATLAWLQSLTSAQMDALLSCSITRIMISDMLISNDILKYYNTAIDNNTMLAMMGYPTISGSKINDSDIPLNTVYAFKNAERITNYKVLGADQIKLLWQQTSAVMGLMSILKGFGF